MQASMFNARVPLPDRDDVFLLNTFTDAQLVVSRDVAELLDRLERTPSGAASFDAAERGALRELAEHGFIVRSREAEWEALEEFFRSVREDRSELRVTVLTTLQCNFACDYCFQGDHGDYNKFAAKMSPETAEHVGDWIEARLDEVQPERFALTFFGGEPLLNVPVMYRVAERAWTASEVRRVPMKVSIITNGLLLSPEVVDRMLPFGLSGIKITLDGDRDTHNRMRPLRGGQGTFDRIVENVRRVADRVSIAIGGNFDETSVDSYPALLDFLKAQDFADRLGRVAFKPVIREKRPAASHGFIPLTAIGGDGKPLGGTCMTSAGAGTGTPCDSCHFLDEKMVFLREETRKRGFNTLDGLHMGPCEIHKRHAYTIGPEGSLYACPGFTGEPKYSTGHIDGRHDAWRDRAAEAFDALDAWRQCGDCTFIPVCAGGCSVASHTELGDMNTPACHKSSFESALITIAHEAAGVASCGHVNTSS